MFVSTPESNPYPIAVLVPDEALVPESLSILDVNAERYEHLLLDMQRLRGQIYLREGAIRPNQLTPDGRHCLEADERSWNLLLVKNALRVVGCARYREHRNTVAFHDLTVAGSAIAQSPAWGPRFRHAVESEVRNAKQKRVAFVELGGWAIADELRGTTQALRIAMVAYGLGRHLGGCIGITTATTRNRSSSMLRRFGGSSLQIDGCDLPPYYDPFYGCEMEIIVFDSHRINPKYEQWLSGIETELACAPSISRNPTHGAGHFAGDLHRLGKSVLPAHALLPVTAGDAASA